MPAGRSVSASSSPSTSEVSGVAGAGLTMIGRADRQRRRDLVRDEVEREVERRDAEDRALGEAPHERCPARHRRLGVESDQLATLAAYLLGRPAEGRHRPGDLRPRPLDRLAVLGGDQLGQLVGPLGETARDMHERLGPGADRQPGGGPLDGVGRNDRVLDLGGGRHRHGRHERRVVRVQHVEDVPACGRPAGEEEGAYIGHSVEGTAALG